MQSGHDPNFPVGLNILPSHDRCAVASSQKQAAAAESEGVASWTRDTRDDIAEYGIAGRIWEAAYLLQRYLTAPKQGDLWEFDPPCPAFARQDAIAQPVYAVELGAGVGLVGIHLAIGLGMYATSAVHRVVLTDLENVVRLMERNIASARDKLHTSVTLEARALPWGSQEHADAISAEADACGQQVNCIICSDLIYFTELLAPLLRTLLTLTASSPQVQVLVGYKIRSLPKEEPFWRAFGVWFDFEPVRCRASGRHMAHDNGAHDSWQRLGSQRAHLRDLPVTSDIDVDGPADDDVYIFVARRKGSSLAFLAPERDDALMSGLMQARDDADNAVQGTGAEAFECLRMAESMAFD